MVHSFLLFSHRIVNLQMLEIQSVTKQYGRFVANNSISLTINSGTIFGLLGPNGAGKTTLIRMITNITTPDSGTILLNGQPVAEVAHNRIGYLPEERGLYKKLTVREQLTYFGMLKGMSAAEMRTSLNTWLDRLDARGWENKKISELSKGMQQKVQFISAVQHAPSLVILDEPFTGLDPVNAQLLISTVRTLRSENVTVILSTHQMDQVEKLCDDIALINFWQCCTKRKSARNQIPLSQQSYSF
ncbi:MAG: ABC transporter ATP-binding protein [Chlorobi bacterium OLB6]|nr:MAG: ABC transporter ATP-binding protein [Chlorobi bacterium OLB6]